MGARSECGALLEKEPDSLCEFPPRRADPHLRWAERTEMSARILLVEDERGLVMTLSDLLIAEGYEVETALDGPSGLAKATKDAFDLILLDVMLPGKNGFEVCREIRQRGSDVAILMLTAK